MYVVMYILCYSFVAVRGGMWWHLGGMLFCVDSVVPARGMKCMLCFEFQGVVEIMVGEIIAKYPYK